MSKEIPLPAIIAVIAVIAVVLIGIAWKVFAGPSDPQAGWTTAQKVDAAKKAMSAARAEKMQAATEKANAATSGNK